MELVDDDIGGPLDIETGDEYSGEDYMQDLRRVKVMLPFFFSLSRPLMMHQRANSQCGKMLILPFFLLPCFILFYRSIHRICALYAMVTLRLWTMDSVALTSPSFRLLPIAYFLGEWKSGATLSPSY
jgi:hypothetical protein